MLAVDWAYVFYGVLIVGAFAVVGDVIAFCALLGLGYQAVQWLQTGRWPSYTLGSHLHVPVDFQPTHWIIVDRLIHFVLFDIETAFVLIMAAGLAVPIKEWLARDGSFRTLVRGQGAPGASSAAQPRPWDRASDQ
jgi:hypothetical protein